MMDIFKEELKKLCPFLSESQLEKNREYFNILTEKNKVMNLTRITDEKTAAENHFADSLYAAEYIPKNAKVIDVGTGGGFPSVPLAVAREDIEMTAIDSVGKKVNFVSEACQTLGIKINAFPARAEEIAKKEFRESFDVCVSRAVADMRVLAELCLPLVKKGGIFIAYKGECEEELENAKPAIKALGGKTREVKTFACHCLVIVDKISGTDKKYPRRYAKILKEAIK